MPAGETEKSFEEFDVIKRYFSQIFSVLNKDIRERFIKLNFSDKVKKMIVKELAFLSEDKQKDYLDELVKLYNNFLKKA